MRHGQTDHPRAQGSFCHHRENRSSKNNAITQKLQIHTQPPEQNDIPECGYISVRCQSIKMYHRMPTTWAVVECKKASRVNSSPDCDI